MTDIFLWGLSELRIWVFVLRQWRQRNPLWASQSIGIVPVWGMFTLEDLTDNPHELVGSKVFGSSQLHTLHQIRLSLKCFEERVHPTRGTALSVDAYDVNTCGAMRHADHRYTYSNPDDLDQLGGRKAGSYTSCKCKLKQIWRHRESRVKILPKVAGGFFYCLCLFLQRVNRVYGVCCVLS